MVRHPANLKKLGDDLARKEGMAPYARAMRMFTSLWQEGKELGVIPDRDPLAGIEIDIITQAIKRADRVEIMGTGVCFASPEDVMIH